MVPDLRVTKLNAGLIRLARGTRYEVPASTNAIAYNVESGEIAVELLQRPPVKIGRGGHCSLPKGSPHALYVPDHPIVRTQLLEAPYARAATTNDDGSLVFVTSIAASTNPLPDIVPRCIALSKRQMIAENRLDQVFALIKANTLDGLEDRSQIVNRLAEIAAIALIEHVLRLLKSRGLDLEAGANDPQVRRVLQAIHERPGDPWNLDLLARHAGLSRSVLAERFKHKVGHSPIEYLARVRVAQAERLLGDASLSISEIAYRVGYQSDASFHKAFKRLIGKSPSCFRTGGVERP